MQYLIICSYYPPDSEISAVRPFMFAKYLSAQGNKVVVLRSGAFLSEPDKEYESLSNVKVISYLGSQSDAEQYIRGEYQKPASVKGSTQKHGRMMAAIRTIYHFLREPFYAYTRISCAKKNFLLQKKALDAMKEDIDVVVSTYSELENVFAGKYAANRFHAKWIMDFRDSIVDHINGERYIWNIYAKLIQKRAVSYADLCTAVSSGLSEELRKNTEQRIETLYNGFESDEVREKNETNNCKLTFCYTGQIYGLRLSALEHFVLALKTLLDAEKIRIDDIAFVYAGPNSPTVVDLFAKYNVDSILDDRGQVPRSEAIRIQNDTDVFLVLSWNTKTARGILTGKFYEGIRAGKPILSIVEGDEPNSELKNLNEQYHYGFCFEACAKDTSIKDLSDYIFCLYCDRSEHGTVTYIQNKALEEAFEYKAIVKRLNDLALHLCEEE